MTMEHPSQRLERLCRRGMEWEDFPMGEINWFRAWNSGQNWWSAKAGQLFARGEDDPLSTEELLRMVVREDRQALVTSWLEIFERQRYTAVYRVRTGEGIKWIEETGWFCLDDEEPCTMGVVREITDLCQVIRDRCGMGDGWLGHLLHQEQNLAKMLYQDYFTCLVHDLKGPVSTALASLQMMEHRMEREIPDQYSRDYKKYCEFISQSCYRLLLSITDLWDTGRLNRGDSQPVFAQWDLEEIIREAMESCRSHWGDRQVELTVQGEGDACICCDREKVTCVLLKVLANAIRSTARDGKIQVVLIRKESHFQVEIRDNGSPIPHETLYRLFSYPFLPNAQFVRDGLGIGLGMWLAQLLVNLHDGHIWASSQEGEGNRFVFTLARSPAAAAESAGILRDRPLEERMEQRLRMEMSVLPLEDPR